MHTASSVHQLKINNIAKQVNFSNNNDIEIEHGLLDGGAYGECDGFSFVEISTTNVTGMILFDRLNNRTVVKGLLQAVKISFVKTGNSLYKW